MTLSPELLDSHHQLSGFSRGVTSLDDWLKRRARPNQTADASRTYVACEGDQVVADYALAAGGEAPS